MGQAMILYNAVRCLDCKEILHSKYNHDFQRCECGSFTDGGSLYQRYGGNVENLSLTDEDAHELIREKAKWGRNYDKDKNLLPETEWTLIKDIAQDHLEALLEYTVNKPINKIFRNELLYRK